MRLSEFNTFDLLYLIRFNNLFHIKRMKEKKKIFVPPLFIFIFKIEMVSSKALVAVKKETM